MGIHSISVLLEDDEGASNSYTFDVTLETSQILQEYEDLSTDTEEEAVEESTDS